MRTNITVFPSAARFFGCLAAFDMRSGIPPGEELSPNSEGQISDTVVGLDAYKLAVLILVTASILTLCL
jgi:hypothetical protein